MSDTNEPDVDFTEPAQANDDFEVAVLRDGEVPPVAPPPAEDKTKVTMTVEEYQALQAKLDSNAALTAGLGQLTEKLGTPTTPANVVMPQDDWDPSKLEQDLFAAGKSVGTIEKVVQRQLGGFQAQLMQNLVQQNKQMLQINPKTSDLFRTYEPEIERRIAALPPQYRMQPGIYENIYRQVVMDNQESIIASAVTAGVAKATANAEAAASAQASKARVPLYNEQGGTSAPKAPLPKVYLTAQDVVRMQEAMLDPTDKAHVTAYLSRKKELGGK